MGNKSKQHQSAQNHINDYERSKMLRVQENQVKLRELGVKNIAKSFTSLVESQKTKKKKDKPMVTNEKDAPYIPDFGDENDGDYFEEFATSVRVPRKKQRPQYIAPMSMNRYANLVKQRVIAPNVSNMLPLEEGCQQNKHLPRSNALKKSMLQQSKEGGLQDGTSIDTHAAKNSKLQQYEEGLFRNGKSVDTHATKKSRSLQFEEGILQNGKFVDTQAKNSRLQNSEEGPVRNVKSVDKHAAKQNHTKATITMGELILNKRGSHNLAKPNATKNNISSGPRGNLFLVDNDDDEEDVMSLQDVNGAHKEQDDENEDMETTFENIQNEIEDDYVGSEDDNEVDKVQDGAENDESEYIDTMIFENIKNGIAMDDSDENLEIESDELVQEQFQGPHIEREAVISTIKKRGPTMMHGVHVRKFDAREVILCNEFGQPIGPVTQEKDVVGQFSRFLGTIARTYSYAPLIYSSWHKVPHKEKMWEYVLEKYIVPEDAKSWVLKSIGCCWRVYKCRLKEKHFTKHKDNKTRWRNRPKTIPDNDFSTLLRLWNKKDMMDRCLRARNLRMSQKSMHTAGPKSFARIRDEMRNEHPNKEPPNLTQMFERTRKRKDGNLYVDTFDDTAKKIEQMKSYKPIEDESALVDPYLAVMSKEYNGHRRLYGRGVTNKLIKKGEWS